MRRLIEASTALAGAAVAVAAVVVQGVDALGLVLMFSALVVLAENTAVLVHRGTSASPGFMIVMGAIAVAEPRGVAIAVAALVGASGGIDVQHLRNRRWGIVAFNAGQFSLAAAAAAATYSATGGMPPLLRLVAATAAYACVNVTLIVHYVAVKEGERRSAVWLDMRPALGNYLAFGMVGLVIGLLATKVGAYAVLLLVIPMVVARWTFRSFERTKEAQEASVRLFSQLIEAKDPYTAGHTDRVSRYSVAIAEQLGMSADATDHLRVSALMHDVGKLAVPGALLNKPGKLTPEEWEIVRRHNEAGLSILGQIAFMRSMAVVASDRHGRFETGAGGTPEPLVREAHVVAVADAYDAMTSTRSYRRALSHEVAAEELRRNAGTQFDPACVDALLAALDADEELRALPRGDGQEFSVPPPVAGVGSAGLGDLLDGETG